MIVRNIWHHDCGILHTVATFCFFSPQIIYVRSNQLNDYCKLHIQWIAMGRQGWEEVFESENVHNSNFTNSTNLYNSLSK